MRPKFCLFVIIQKTNIIFLDSIERCSFLNLDIFLILISFVARNSEFYFGEKSPNYVF